MLNLLCSLISKMIFSGINGVVLIPLVAYLLWVLKGQAKEFINISKKIFNE